VSEPDDPPRYVLIAEDLRAQIEDGKFKAGELLAPIAELAEQYDVTRQTVAKALRLLEGEGRTARYPGIGWVVDGAGDARAWVWLADGIRLLAADGRLKPGDQLNIAALHRAHNLAKQTVIKALRVLEGEGLVMFRGSKSPVVAELERESKR
jgi:DNA-binding GntR family transcriptional regulator